MMCPRPASSVRVRRTSGEHGAALVVALGAMTLMLALGTGLLLVTMTDAKVVANFREGREALHAAEGALERVIPDLLRLPDWDQALTGLALSSFVDGPASGARVLPDGSTLDLAVATSGARCGRAACSDADLDAVTGERPWGANNPRWQLFGFGPVRDLLPGDAIDSRAFVVVWIADDPSETDGNPFADGTAAENPGRGVVALRAHAYGAFGTRREVDVTLGRRGRMPRILTWHEGR
jgi:hypothetical protein